MLQGQRDLFTVGQMLLSELAPLVNAQQGAIYQMDSVDGDVPLRLLAGYAQSSSDGIRERIALGEGLVGQCAHGETAHSAHRCARRLHARSSPASGEAPPANIVVLPVLFEGQTKAVIELASLQPFTAAHLTFLEQLTAIASAWC